MVITSGAAGPFLPLRGGDLKTTTSRSNEKFGSWVTYKQMLNCQIHCVLCVPARGTSSLRQVRTCSGARRVQSLVETSDAGCIQ